MTEPPFAVLIVDDEENNREVLQRKLQRYGYQLTLASSGKEALELVRQQDFDLVLLDVMMPEMDGLEVLSTLRETHNLTELPVIMVTARDQSGDVVAALQLGANDHVSKPINFPILMARIQNHLAIRRTQREAQAQAVSSASIATSPPPTPSRIVDCPTMPDQQTMLGDYEILQELGRGGMGVVYQARHARMNRLVALKVIAPDYWQERRDPRRFYQEIQAAAKLSHPNIVMAFDAGQAGDTHYLAMEFVQGIDLERLVLDAGPLPVHEACSIIEQACRGLQHAHEQGLVHRDIKPSNLLVTDPPQRIAKILDMGLALALSQDQPTRGLTEQGVIVGTADFMSPEQGMDSHAVDHRADIYSLGCTFYFALTGKLPFDGNSPVEIMLKHYLDEPQAIESMRSDVPLPVLGVIKRMMAKKADQRFPSCGEIADRLKTYSRNPQRA